MSLLFVMYNIANHLYALCFMMYKRSCFIWSIL